LSWTAGLPAMRALLNGRFEEAEQVAGEALALAQSAGNRNAVLGSTVQLCHVARERGRAEQALETARRTGGGVFSWRVYEALLLLECGRAEQARSRYDELAANEFVELRSDRIRLAVLTVLPELCARLDDTTHAEQVYDLLQP